MCSYLIKLKTNFIFNKLKNLNRNMCTQVPIYEELLVTVPKPYVYHVELNRPKKLNAMNSTMWENIGKCFEKLSDNPDCRVIVLSGAGKLFCAGIDLNDMVQLAPQLAEQEDIARKCKILEKMIRTYQKNITALELCNKPVIAAVHSACVGGAVDLITAADVRYCSNDAWFQIKEVDIGMAADVGTLQRLPKIIGSDSLVRELCYTARKLPANEALQCGLVSKIFNTRDDLITGAISLAEIIASKSPVAVQGTKRSLVYSRDHSVQEGLDYLVLWNQAMLQSEDFINGAMAQLTKDDKVTFAKL